MAQWTYLLADLRTGIITGEVELSGVRMSKRLNGAGTMSGTWDLATAKTGQDPSVLTAPARTVGYALRDGRPMWGGILWARRRTSDSAKLDLGFADFFSYFDHRYVLPAFTPSGSTAQVSALSTVYGGVEQNQIARNLVAQAQAHTGGNIGIVCDTTTSGVVRGRTWAGYEMTDVGTALRNLTGVIDGPDLMFDVGSSLDADGRVVRLLRIGTPILGQQGAAHVFEYGANIMSYTWESDGSRMATRTYATGEGVAAAQLIAVAENGTRYPDGWPLLETQASYPTVSVDATLSGHAAADLYRGRLPVITPTFTVRGDTRPSIGEYAPGDEVRIVIRDEFFRRGIDLQMRIVALDFDPGDNGPETAAITVNPIADDVV